MSRHLTDRGDVLAALDAVRDPELDEPVTELGFVSSCTVSAYEDVEVRLRLPTYFCAPNFAFLMVAAAVALLAAFAYFAGRSEIRVELTPSRTVSQLKQDIEITKEQLT